MNQIKKRLTYANVMSSIAVFLLLGGGAAFAAKQLGKNTVGAKQLKKNSVATAELKKNAVNAAKIKKNAVTTAKIRNNAVTGAKVNEATLGTVPSAGSAASASSLVGQTSFQHRLSFGQQQVIASHGTVALTAECFQEGGDDYARISMSTSQNGAVAEAEDDYDGEGGDFLNTDTPLEDREFVYNSTASGETDVETEIDYGFVMGPDGKALVANTEGILLGLNYAGSNCVIGGVVNAIG